MSDTGKEGQTENQVTPNVLDAGSLSKRYPRNVELYTTINVRRMTRDTLKKLKDEFKFRTYDATLNYMALEVTRGSAIPPASFEACFRDTRPIILTGKSGSGKTTAVREMLSKWSGPVFVLDVNNEYADFTKLDLGKILSPDIWRKPANQRIRFVPENEYAVDGQATSIFNQFISVLKATGALKEWTLCIEEGHRFAKNADLRTLLIEGRKFTRKVILVVTDQRKFAGLVDVFKPKPWEPVPARSEIEQKEALLPGQPSESIVK